MCERRCVCVAVRKHVARATGDLEGRGRGVAAEHIGRLLEPSRGGPAAEQRRDPADCREHVDRQRQGVPLHHRLFGRYEYTRETTRVHFTFNYTRLHRDISVVRLKVEKLARRSVTLPQIEPDLTNYPLTTHFFRCKHSTILFSREVSRDAHLLTLRSPLVLRFADEDEESASGQGGNNNNGGGGGKMRNGGSYIHLWQFLKELLQSPGVHGSCIRWLDRGKGVFKIEDSVRVARLWGKRKNRPAMNYDKLSRSIRQYYKKGIMKKTERSQRLVYQFCHPYCL